MEPRTEREAAKLKRASGTKKISSLCMDAPKISSTGSSKTHAHAFPVMGSENSLQLTILKPYIMINTVSSFA